MEAVKAIVYESNTGFTKKYAELLSQALNIPTYERKLADGFLKEKDEIVYLGWLKAGSIVGYNKVKNLYNIKVVCGVGMAVNGQKELDAKYKEEKGKIFYLQGGFDIDKLKGMDKFAMKIMSKILGKVIAKKEVKSEEDLATLEMLHGGDKVSAEKLEPVLQYLR